MTMTSRVSPPRSPREFTGRKMLAIMVIGFGVIISVNLFMAYSAISSFPGLEVKNSYVASQDFDRDRLAQERLGWQASARLEGGELSILLTAEDGSTPVPAEISAKVGRATESRDDFYPELNFDGSAWIAKVDLPQGSWRLWLDAVAQDGTKFRQRLLIEVPRG